MGRCLDVSSDTYGLIKFNYKNITLGDNEFNRAAMIRDGYI